MRASELVPGVILHTELNPKLWTLTNKLTPKVRAALLKIAIKFHKFLEVPVQVKDVIITGSQANYSYTDKSDLDLHLIIDYNRVQCDQPVDELFDTKRSLWKLKHNINIHDIPVELYVEDLNKPVTGSSYSIILDQWINHPQRHAEHLPGGVDGVTNAWISVINNAIAQDEIKELYMVRDLIKNYRRLGLKQQGEFGRANIVFKTLRNNGKINQLMKAITDAEDQSLSLD